MNPIAFEFFGTAVYWYGIIMATAVLTAFLVVSFLMRKLGYKDDIPFEILLAIVPIGIIGARLYFIIFSGTSFTEFFQFRSGGIAIYGAIIAGGAGLWIYTKFIRKCAFFAVADVLVIGLIIAQSVGRWGNFFNSEVYGFSTSFHFFPLTVMISGEPRLALFFIESLLNLFGFFILLKVFVAQKRWGIATGFYLIYYGIVRAVLEPLRDSSYILKFWFMPVSLLISLATIALGVLLLYLVKVGRVPQQNVSLLADGNVDDKSNITEEKDNV